MKIEKRTAGHAYSQNATDSKKLMALLFEKLNDTDAHEADWGNVGDAAHIRGELMNLAVGIFCPNGGDEFDTIADVNKMLEGMPMPFIDAHTYPRRTG